MWKHVFLTWAVQSTTLNYALQVIPTLSLLPFYVLFVFCVCLFLSEMVFGFKSFIEFGVWEFGIEFRSNGDSAAFVDVQDSGFLN